MRESSYDEVIDKFDEYEYVGLLVEVFVEVGLVERLETVKLLCFQWLVTRQEGFYSRHEP